MINYFKHLKLGKKVISLTKQSLFHEHYIIISNNSFNKNIASIIIWLYSQFKLPSILLRLMYHICNVFTINNPNILE